MGFRFSEVMFKPVRNLGAIIVDSLREEFIDESFIRIGRCQNLLEVGCGTKPFYPIYSKFVSHSVGTDVPFSPHNQEKIDTLALATALPFKDETFDVVLCTEVMEHVPEPQIMLDEIYRVLKPEGTLILTTPFLVPLHEQPYDFFRYTPFALRYMLEKSGYDIIIIKPFSELFGVIISFFVQLQLKLWYALSVAMHAGKIYSVANPFILLFVYFPQVAYLKMLHFAQRVRILKKIADKFSYTTKGYGTFAAK